MKTIRTNKWVWLDCRIQDQYTKKQLDFYILAMNNQIKQFNLQQHYKEYSGISLTKEVHNIYSQYIQNNVDRN